VRSHQLRLQTTSIQNFKQNFDMDNIINKKPDVFEHSEGRSTLPTQGSKVKGRNSILQVISFLSMSPSQRHSK
jgi:hypothetical protein